MNHYLLYIFLALFMLSGCQAATTTPIRLNHLEPLPAPTPVTSPPLRVSVASVISPQGTVQSYQPLLDYLSTRLGRQVILIQRRTYTETNELIGRTRLMLRSSVPAPTLMVATAME